MGLIFTLLVHFSVYRLIFAEDASLYRYFQNGDDWESHCSEGYRQSPIDITDDLIRSCDRVSMRLSLNSSPNEIQFALHETHFRTTFISHPLAMIEATDILNRRQYYLLKHYKSIHFHAPGEHLINGERPALSMHMVFHREGVESHEDNYAVIEIMFLRSDDPSNQNLAGDRFLDLLGVRNHPKKKQLNFSEVLEEVIKNPVFYHYKGSMTTPPCSEVVSWFVWTGSLVISEESVRFLEDAWVKDEAFSGGRGNYRLAQYLNGRRVFRVKAEIEDGFEESEFVKLQSFSKKSAMAVFTTLAFFMVLLAVV